MTSIDERKSEREPDHGESAPSAPVGRWEQLRSRLRYGIPLRAKLVLPVLGIACVVVGALFAFAYVTLQSSIASIYEARARSVAAVISKSIQEKDYILYYSDELDADIARLIEQYESILDITVVGITARGFVTVASTDPTKVGALAGSAEAARLDELRGIDVEKVRTSAGDVLRAIHPIGSGAQRAGVVMVDMSLDEQAGYQHRLAWQFGAAAVVGIVLLCGLLALVLTTVVTRPVRQLAKATKAVAERDYSLDPALSPGRTPGTPVRDELSQLADGFHLMTTMIHAHEQELRKLVLLDEVTGLYNADHFREQFPIELGKGRRYGHPTSVIVVDLGGLKGVAAGDQDKVRVRAASFLLSRLRRVDMVFRVAPDRFVGILPETPDAGAAIAAGRIKNYASDVSSSFDFPISLFVTSMGWAADAEASAEDIVRNLMSEQGGHAE